VKRVKRERRHPAGPSILAEADASLLDIVDHVLNKGVVLSGDVMLGLANVDLIYLRLSALLCAADRILPGPPPPAGGRPAARPARRRHP
jgi:Gas vesicle protein